MICLNCGREIADDLRICPFCGSFAEPADPPRYYEDDGFVEQDVSDDEAMDYEEYDDPAEEAVEYDDEEAEEFTDDDPVYGRKKFKGFKMPAVKVPSFGGGSGSFGLPAVLSILSCVLSLVCLVSILSLKSALNDSTMRINSSVSTVQSYLNEMDNRLSGIDSTIAGVQSEAYNQLASQSIVISKDITALTGPVTAGKYNVMFIINAKGNLNINDSFDWQRYNSMTGGWESIVFTGNATTNEQYGLRIANSYNKADNLYVTELWANGITLEAEGTYRCVITDATGIVKNSAEASVQVAEG